MDPPIVLEICYILGFILHIVILLVNLYALIIWFWMFYNLSFQVLSLIKACKKILYFINNILYKNDVSGPLFSYVRLRDLGNKRQFRGGKFLYKNTRLIYLKLEHVIYMPLSFLNDKWQTVKLGAKIFLYCNFGLVNMRLKIFVIYPRIYNWL